ncbi:MAG TPA: NAD(P)-dependent oxidoreductase [Solirubrobacterales bacterium]|nr:NAD(P)-dependent oxidoreductase [Solirubrobacterales bacterium]
MGAFEGKTMIVSGGSRGIGLAIALRAAADGANVALLAKTAEPHPKLDGTVFTAAEEIEAAGGKALPIVGDVRDDEGVAAAVARTAETFGGIDICLNNASAIDLSRTADIAMKRYDLMQDINCRGAFLLGKCSIPYLREAENPHILTLSPPINLNPRWAGGSLAYSIAKYGMSLVTLGLAEELKEEGIAANSLWPRTIIATAAVQNLLGGDEAMKRSRSPQIMADAAAAILARPSRDATGNFYLDDEVLAEEGITDLSAYSHGDGTDLQLDLFLDA